MADQQVRPVFAVCVANDGCDDLSTGMLYRVLTDEAATGEGLVRIIDDSGGRLSLSGEPLGRGPGAAVGGAEATGGCVGGCPLIDRWDRRGPALPWPMTPRS